MMYCLSAAASSREQATALSVLPQVTQFMFSGILLPTKLIPVSLRWLKWICPMYYGMAMLGETEFHYVFKELEDCKAAHGSQWAEECSSTMVRVNFLETNEVVE